MIPSKGKRVSRYLCEEARRQTEQPNILINKEENLNIDLTGKNSEKITFIMYL